jgi:spore coat protein SA
VYGVHILIIAPEQIPVPPVMGGSVEICIHQIAQRLAVSHQVTVISRRHSRYPVIEQNGGLTIVRVPAGTRREYIRSALRAVKGRKFDWIQIDNRPKFVPPVRKAFPRTPVSLYLHSLTFVSPPYITPGRAGECLSRADLIVANSQATVRRLKGMFPKVKDRFRKVWLGVDSERFRPAAPGEREQLQGEYRTARGFTVLFTGRLIPRKGIPVLIRAMKRVRRAVPHAHLVIAGHGKPGYVKSLKRTASRLGVSVQFLGYIPHSKMHEVYRLADCFVCPSQKHESFGLVNVEAMASGLPVVASKLGGIREVVSHKRNGLLVRHYRSSRAFARQIGRLASDRQLAERLSRQARADAEERFGWEETARRLARLYQDVSR